MVKYATQMERSASEISNAMKELAKRSISDKVFKKKLGNINLIKSIIVHDPEIISSSQGKDQNYLLNNPFRPMEFLLFFSTELKKIHKMEITIICAFVLK
jgi:hypothetical protein